MFFLYSLLNSNLFFFVIFCSFINKKLGMLNIKNQKPINGPIILICSNFSLSRYPKNGSFGFMKNKKHISKHNIPPIYPRDQAIPDIFPILFSFETFFNKAL